MYNIFRGRPVVATRRVYSVVVLISNTRDSRKVRNAIIKLATEFRRKCSNEITRARNVEVKCRISLARRNTKILNRHKSVYDSLLLLSSSFLSCTGPILATRPSTDL